MIIKKVTVLDAAGPVIPSGPGTFLLIDVTDKRTFGMYTGTLAEGCESATVDWGDGNRQTVGSINQLTHEYATSGRYVISISDDIQVFGVGCTSDNPFTTDYTPMIVEAVSRGRLRRINMSCFRNAAKLARIDFRETAIKELLAKAFGGCSTLTSLDGLPEAVEKIYRGCFANCMALAGRIDLRGVTNLLGNSDADMPFAGCARIAEIHFAAANERSIKASAAWSVDQHLGAENATIRFDL